MIGIIYNPHANKGRSEEKIKKFHDALVERNVSCEERYTTKSREAIDFAKELSQTCDVIVAAGGDGTVYEVVNGAAHENVSFAIFPVGSGNDVSRSIGMNEKTEEEVIDVLLEPKTRDYDLVRFNGDKYSAQFIAFGLVSSIISYYANSKSGSYYASVLSAMLHHHPKNYRVIIDGKEETYRADFLSVQNVKTAGSGMVLCAEAVDNDGYADLVIVQRKGVLRTLKNLVALLKGNVTKQPNVISKRVRSVTIIPEKEEICCVDGELFPFDRVDVEMDDTKIKMIY